MNKLHDEIMEAEKTLEGSLEAATGAWVTLGIRINAAYQAMLKLKQVVEQKNAKTEQRKGKWREMNHNLGFECSECGWESYYKYDFCPNCGVKMTEGENE